MEQFKFIFDKINSLDCSIKVIFKMKEYKKEEYRILFGVEKNTFIQMLEIIEVQYNIDHQLGGRKDGATPIQRLEITLKYMRQYVSQRYLAIEYKIAKSCISTIIKWCVKILVNDNNFRLPNKVSNINDESEDRIIDATESKIDRPKFKQKDWYSGKKKTHTIKTQVEIGLKTLLIYSIAFAKGSVHDFKLFKQSPVDYNKNITLFVDMGYIGIDKIHKNNIIPIKSSKNHKLSKDEKWYNSEVSKVRIAIEHVNAFIKKFKICSTRFRNKRKNFKLFMTLICGIYNFEKANE